MDDRILGSKLLLENGMVEGWIRKIIKTGNNYVYFHRILANTLYRFLKKQYKRLVEDGLLLYYTDIIY